MAASPPTFLEKWVHSYIYAESRSLDELNDTIDECIRDAKNEGIDRKQLEAQAGGDLVDYIRNAIKKASAE